jgi:polar amino acid transport system permease protein
LSLIASFSFSWTFFEHALAHPSHSFLIGLWRTVYIAVIAQLVGVALGFVVDSARRSSYAPVRGAAWTYVWLLRGTPLLVQLVLVYDGLAAIGIYSFKDVTVFGAGFSGAIQAGIITLGVNESAYMSEIIRASIDSVDDGQLEAAESLGMTRFRAMRHIVLPQALRVMVPPLGNDFNNMMKVTSLLSVIGVEEMFLNAQETNSVTLRTFEIFLAVALYYLLLTTVWGVIQHWIEAKLSISDSARRSSLRERLVGRPDPSLPSLARGVQ